MIPIRMDASLLAAITELAKHEHISPSQAIRDGVRRCGHHALVQVHRSALKHGVSAEDAVRAAQDDLYAANLDDDNPAREL